MIGTIIKNNCGKDKVVIHIHENADAEITIIKSTTIVCDVKTTVAMLRSLEKAICLAVAAFDTSEKYR